VAGRPREVFEGDEQAFDAVLKNLEIIGEAAKRLPVSFKDGHPEIQWREIAGLRDIIVHEYFGLDLDIVWDVVSSRVPDLLVRIRAFSDFTSQARGSISFVVHGSYGPRRIKRPNGSFARCRSTSPGPPRPLPGHLSTPSDPVQAACARREAVQRA
jgi:uncharacterized protein with HEPN domain